MNEQYAVLMVDLKNSRGYDSKGRNLIQQYYSSVILVLNRMFRNEIICEVCFSAGDEVQGLFRRPEAAYLYYRLISSCLYPIQTHASIGVGNVDVRQENKNSCCQDGKAYHSARDAINRADSSIGYPVILLSNSEHDRIINSVIGTTAMMAMKFSITQNQVFLLTELLFPLPCEGIKVERNEDIVELIQMKLDFDHNFGGPQRTIQKMDRLPSPQTTVHIKASAGQESTEYYITAGAEHVSTQIISDILGMTRDSIFRTLKCADFFIIRNMTIAAIEEMQKI